MDRLELSGILSWELNLKKDQNGNDYYHSWLKIKDGTPIAFFFFRPDYDLSLRLAELRINQELTLQGHWSKRNSKVFLASNFYLKEIEQKESFGMFENQFGF